MKRFSLIKQAGVPLFGFFAALFGAILLWRYQTHKVSQEIAIRSDQGIEALEKLSLGNVEQWVLMRGMSKQNPILLFLHGGPGLSIMPFHHRNSALEEHFTVVHWDQRGAGKSYHPDINPESLSVEQLLSDAHELIQYLRQRFQKEKIFLAGHSLGSMLGMHLAERYPHYFYAYVGLGQVTHKAACEQLSYDFVHSKAQEENHPKALKDLQKIGAPPYKSYQDMLIQRKWVQRFGGNLYGRKSSLSLLRFGLTSPHYTPADFNKYRQGLLFSIKHYWFKTYDTNLLEQIPQVNIPVYFCEGRADYVVPATMAEQYYTHLKAPKGKKLVWFEKSGHWPQFEEPHKFHDLMIHQVLQHANVKSRRQKTAVLV